MSMLTTLRTITMPGRHNPLMHAVNRPTSWWRPSAGMVVGVACCMVGSRLMEAVMHYARHTSEASMSTMDLSWAWSMIGCGYTATLGGIVTFGWGFYGLVAFLQVRRPLWAGDFRRGTPPALKTEISEALKGLSLKQVQSTLGEADALRLLRAKHFRWDIPRDDLMPFLSRLKGVPRKDSPARIEN